MKVEFLIFALHKNHLLAYKVEASPALDVFHLRLQLNSAHLKSSFPEQFTLIKKEGKWELQNELEREVSLLIDESLSKDTYTQKTRR
jgi:hypothetical protein